MEDIFFYFLDDIGINNCYKGVMAATFFLPFIMPRIFLVVLVFYASLTLVDRRLLGVLATKYVSGKSVSGLISSGVFFLLFYKHILLEILWINLVDAWS